MSSSRAAISLLISFSYTPRDCLECSFTDVTRIKMTMSNVQRFDAERVQVDVPKSSMLIFYCMSIPLSSFQTESCTCEVALA
jgi:hypothetical protein